MFSSGNRNRYLTLILLIFFVVLAAPFFSAVIGFRILLDLLITGIFLVLMYSMSRKRLNLIVSLVLVTPMLVVIWAKYFVVVSAGLQTLGNLCGVLFFAVCIIGFIKLIQKAQEVTREVIYAAVLVYVLATFVWAFLYAVLEMLAPGSFSYPEGHTREFLFQFIYFSIVTITTLGYGDILPLSQEASALAMVEALMGQMYLVVVVAWLVGMHVSRRSIK
jgi:hypothetical protein